MRLAGHAVLKGKTIYAYRILIRNLEKKKQDWVRLGYVGAQYKKIPLNKKGCWKSVEIILAEDRNQCYSFVHKGKNFRI